MADEAEATERTCFKCGGLPLAKPDGILCVSCRDFLASQTAREIYAALSS